MPQPPALMLLGIVVTTAVGALALCALLLRHGVAPDSDAEAFTAQRLFVFRLAHVVALGCFAISAILGVAAASIAWRAQSLASETAIDDTIAVRRDLRRQRDALLEQVHRLDERLTAAERRLDAASSSTPARLRVLRGGKPSVGSRRPRATTGEGASASPGSTDPRIQAETREPTMAAPSRFVSAAPPATGPMARIVAPPALAAPAPLSPADSSPAAVAPSDPPPALVGGSTAEADAPLPAQEDTGASSFCGRDAHHVCSRVTRWATGEVKEFRDGMRRQIDEFRDGVERVKTRLRRVRDTFAR